MIGGSSAQSALLSSVLSLLAFAAIGYLIGRLGEQVVLESVKQRFDRDLKAREKVANAAPRGSTTVTEN
jgi:hypothetical protein